MGSTSSQNSKQQTGEKEENKPPNGRLEKEGDQWGDRSRDVDDKAGAKWTQMAQDRSARKQLGRPPCGVASGVANGTMP